MLNDAAIFKYTIYSSEITLPILWPVFLEKDAPNTSTFTVWGQHKRLPSGDPAHYCTVQIVGTGWNYDSDEWVHAQTVRDGDFIWHLLVKVDKELS